MEYTMLTEVRTDEAKAIRRANQKLGRDYNPKRAKKLIPRTDGLVQALQTAPTNDHFVLVTPKLTSTQSQLMKGTLMDTQTSVTQQELMKQNSPTLTSWWEAFPAKRFLSLVKDMDLTTPEGHSFLTSHGFYPTKDPDIFCLKTSKVYLVTTAAKLSRQSLGFSPTLGMTLNGKFLTQKTSAFPKTGKGSSLSDILEENVPDKYFLSQERIDKMFSRVQKNKAAGRGFQPLTVGMGKDGQLKPMFEQTSRIHERGGVESNRTNGIRRTPYTDGARVRRLTPKECERLMSWPDNWTIGSDTQRYKQCGNGVVSNCVQAVIEKMHPCLTTKEEIQKEG